MCSHLDFSIKIDFGVIALLVSFIGINAPNKITETPAG